MSMFRECPGEWIDQDGGEIHHWHTHDDLQCPECDGVFCEQHFNTELGLCRECAEDDPLGDWDYHA